MLPDLSKIIEYNFKQIIKYILFYIKKTLPAHNVYTTFV